MIRIVIFGAVVVALTALGLFFTENPGFVAIDWLGVHVETNMGVLLLSNLVLLVAVVLVVLVLRGMMRLPKMLGMMSDRRHSRLGRKALTQALVDLEAGDVRQALKSARKVDTHLKDETLSRVLTAKAAELEGREDAARRQFELMLKTPSSEFFGLRGLLSLALKAGDTTEALRLARKAHALRPKIPWVIVTLFDLAIGRRDWRMALDSLKEAVKAEALSADEVARRRAVLLTALAKQAQGLNNTYEASKLLRQAIAARPDYVAAWVEQARVQILVGKPRKARELIEEIWKIKPSRVAGDLFVSALEGRPEVNLRSVQRLAAVHPSHAESLTLVGEQALKHGDLDLAREKLEAALEQTMGVRQARLMADLEEAAGNEACARDWLVKASAANPDPSWTCASCGTATDIWDATCPNCDAFGSLDWRSPLRFVHLPDPNTEPDTNAEPPSRPAEKPDAA